MRDITSKQLIALLRCAHVDSDIATTSEAVYIDNFAATYERLDAMLPLLPALAGVERVLFHGDPEPVEDFELRPGRQRHYYTVDASRRLYGEMWTHGTDGGQPWTFVRPTSVGPAELRAFSSWDDIPKLMFPLLWKPNGRDS